MIEVWKPISEFSEYYQISNLGNVRRIGRYSNQSCEWESKNPYVLTPRKHSNGYLRVMLSVNNRHYDRYIHRLVALEFCKNSDPKIYKEVNHIDGNKENNCADNLEWCDRSYNNKHAYKNGMHTVHGCYGKKKPVAQIDPNSNRVVKIYESVECASLHVGLKNYSNISACCNYAENPSRYKRPCISAKGFKWRFANRNMKVGSKID